MQTHVHTVWVFPWWLHSCLFLHLSCLGVLTDKLSCFVSPLLLFPFPIHSSIVSLLTFLWHPASALDAASVRGSCCRRGKLFWPRVVVLSKAGQPRSSHRSNLPSPGRVRFGRQQCGEGWKCFPTCTNTPASSYCHFGQQQANNDDVGDQRLPEEEEFTCDGRIVSGPSAIQCRRKKMGG